MCFFRRKNKNIRPELNSESLPKIFPLSPKQDLLQPDLTEFKEYEKFLRSAFSQPNIRNILIAGEFGVGKSSIIRSVENCWLKKSSIICSVLNRLKRSEEKGGKIRHGFLYVSLGDYIIKSNNNEPPLALGESGGRKDKADGQADGNDDNQKNFLERRLLLQIYAASHRADLLASSFKLIPEHNICSKWITPIICAIMAVVLLLLGLHVPISHLLSAVFSDRISAELKSEGHLVLYVLAILFAAIATFRVVQYQLPKLQTKSLSIKADSLEAKCESSACESYLDQHITELVYCLEQIAKKINYTVVFEDLDRFDAKTCLEIFTRLREINYIVNLRLSPKCKRPLRFIYVANDSILAHLKHSKFFDYIMPVYPRLNQKTAESILAENLKEVYEESNFITESSILVHVAAPYLSDYRLQYTVLNDFNILLRLYQSRNSNEADAKSAVDILALAIYKNYFPSDFSKIWEGKSNVFPHYKPDAFNERDRTLLDSLHPYLPLKILYYVGFKREAIVELRKAQLKNNGVAATLRTLDSQDSELQLAMQEICSEAMIQFSNEKVDGISADDLVTMIRYMVKKEYTDWDWLFKGKKIPAIIAISVLARVTHTNSDGIEEIDRAFLDTLLKLANFDPNGDKSIFEGCKEFGEMKSRRDLSDLEQQVLVLGTGKRYDGNFTFNGNILLKDCILK